MRAAAEGAAGAPALLPLLTLFSPAFPIGGFAWSHGLESAIREGRVSDATGTEAWIAFLLARGSGWNDLVLLAAAHAAAAPGDRGALDEARELGAALAGSAERRHETLELGGAFLEAASAYLGDAAGAASDGAGYWPYPVAAGWLAGSAGLPLPETLHAFAHAFAAQLVSSAVRLVPLGQRDQVRVMAALAPALEAASRRAEASTLEDLGSAAFLSDIAAMRHETLQPRLFRS